jgi:hypothetical protein
MKNLLPEDPVERAIAKRIVAARDPRVLRPEYQELHRTGACDPMTGYCSLLSVALFHAIGGKRGPYLVFRIGRADMGGVDTHWFLVDARKLPRGWQRDPTAAFRSLPRPKAAVVDLTASQFGDAPIPYERGYAAALSRAPGGDVAPTPKVMLILERAGLS